MNYNNIHDADGLASFVKNLMSSSTKYALYTDIKRKYPELLPPDWEPDQDPDGLIGSLLWYVFYTAGWNLIHHLTGSETGGDDTCPSDTFVRFKRTTGNQLETVEDEVRRLHGSVLKLWHKAQEEADCTDQIDNDLDHLQSALENFLLDLGER